MTNRRRGVVRKQNEPFQAGKNTKRMKRVGKRKKPELDAEHLQNDVCVCVLQVAKRNRGKQEGPQMKRECQRQVDYCEQKGDEDQTDIQKKAAADMWRGSRHG